MNKKRVQSNLMLLLTALIWGVAFVAQSAGMEYVGPFTFNAEPVSDRWGCTDTLYFLLNRIKHDENEDTKEQSLQVKGNKGKLVLGGICCGIVLGIASTLQQFGIKYTTVGKAGFITALYIIIVPILGILFKKKVSFTIWMSVAIAAVGMYLLCINEGFSISKGDFFALLGAVCFSVHILVIDYFSPFVDGVKMSCIQFFVAGVLCSVMMFIFEKPSVSAIVTAWLPILYAGVLSCGVAYTLQIIGQKNTNPTVASLVLSMESVFSVLAGWLILGQKLSAREILGCVFVFGAIILAQIPAPVGKE